MSRVSDRETSREGGRVYCLIGIFDITMPKLYGEGSKTFLRLRKEIIGKPPGISLFPCKANLDVNQEYTRVLAPSPPKF